MGKKVTEEVINTVYACSLAWNGKMAVIADEIAADTFFKHENTDALMPLGNYTEKQVYEACLVLEDRCLMRKLQRRTGMFSDPCIRFKVLTPHEIVERKRERHE